MPVTRKEFLRELWDKWQEALLALEALPRHNPAAKGAEAFEDDVNRRLATLAVQRAESHYKREVEDASDSGVDRL